MSKRGRHDFEAHCLGSRAAENEHCSTTEKRWLEPVRAPSARPSSARSVVRAAAACVEKSGALQQEAVQGGAAASRSGAVPRAVQWSRSVRRHESRAIEETTLTPSEPFDDARTFLAAVEPKLSALMRRRLRWGAYKIKTTIDMTTHDAEGNEHKVRVASGAMGLDARTVDTLVIVAHHDDIDAAVATMNGVILERLATHAERGSGYTVTSVDAMEVRVIAYEPLGEGSATSSRSSDSSESSDSDRSSSDSDEDGSSDSDDDGSSDSDDDSSSESGDDSSSDSDESSTDSDDSASSDSSDSSKSDGSDSKQRRSNAATISPQLPPWLAAKKCFVSVNVGAVESFKYALLAAMHSDEVLAHRARRASYASYEDTVDVVGPTSIADAKRYANRNELPLYIFTLDTTKNSKDASDCRIVHVSRVATESEAIVLLALSQGDDAKKPLRWGWIRRLNAFMRASPTNVHACAQCLRQFKEASAYENHKRANACLASERFVKVLPSRGAHITQFKNVRAQLLHPFVVYADCESMLRPIESNSSGSGSGSGGGSDSGGGGGSSSSSSSGGGAYQDHVVRHVGAQIVSKIPNVIESTYVQFDGDNCMRDFLAHVLEISAAAKAAVLAKVPMRILTRAERVAFKAATSCWICAKSLGKDRVHDHDHITGEYRGVAHKNCNLALNFRGYRLPIFFHNLSGYDGHLIIAHAARCGKPLSCIAKDADKYISFTLGACEFKDSAHFLAAPLAELATSMRRDANDSDETILDLAFASLPPRARQLLREKGVFPYDWYDAPSRLDEAALPPREAFFSRLHGEGVSIEDYARAQDVWAATSCRTMRDYLSLYLKTDVLLLAEVFELFRAKSFALYGLDPAHFYTLPGFSWSAMLKMTRVEIGTIYAELQGGMEMLDILQRAMRGGVSMITTRFAEANNPYLGTPAQRARYAADVASGLVAPLTAAAASTAAAAASNAIFCAAGGGDMAGNAAGSAADDAASDAAGAIRAGAVAQSTHEASISRRDIYGWDPALPPSYLMYWDANNLYGGSMREALPIQDYWLEHARQDTDASSNGDINGDNSGNNGGGSSISGTNSGGTGSRIIGGGSSGSAGAVVASSWRSLLRKILALPDDGERGCFVEVDLHVPPALHDYFNDYPLAPERTLFEPSPLMSARRSELGLGEANVPKLIPNLHDKVKYVLHYRALKQCVALGLVVKALHRVVWFKQAPFMRPYIDFNTARRAAATSKFEKDMFKLMNNAIFGKTCENVEKRIRVLLKTTGAQIKKYGMRPDLQDIRLVGSGLAVITLRKTRVVYDRPLAIGAAITDISKTFMYDFHYGHIQPRYGASARLLFTDTDSLAYHIRTPDVYKDMAERLELFDTSEYPRDHFCYSAVNAKVVLKMKDEYKSEPIRAFVGLRPKMYCILGSDGGEKATAKGIKRSAAKALRFEAYKVALMLPMLMPPSALLPLESPPASRSHARASSSSQSLTLLAESSAATEGDALSAAAGIVSPPASVAIGDSDAVTAAALALAAAPRHMVAFNVIRSHCHRIVSATVEKAGLCCFDDKRYVLDDGVYTLAHGHWRIPR